MRYRMSGGPLMLRSSSRPRLIAEMIAQYGSSRTVEMMLGPKARELYRREGIPTYSRVYSGTGCMRLAEAGYDQLLSDLRPSFTDRELAYSKGGLAFYALAEELGPVTFGNALKRMGTDHQFGHLSLDAFWTGISQASGRDVSEFVHQWFRSTGIPEWRLKWTQNQGRPEITVTQLRCCFYSSVPLVIVGDHQIMRERISLRSETSHFDRKVRFTVKNIEVDPHFTIAHWTREYEEFAQTIAPYVRAREQQISRGTDDLLKLIDDILSSTEATRALRRSSN
jgi:hypothetical protein